MKSDSESDPKKHINDPRIQTQDTKTPSLQDGAPQLLQVDLSLVIPIYNHGQIGFAGVITTL